jgi:hypothetical protein
MAKQKQEEMATDDAVLLMLLSLVEADGLEVDITLNVKGAVVTGTLIGPTAYYEGITEAARALPDETMSKIFTKKFNDLKDEYTQQKQEQQSEKEGSECSATFIHLKNVQHVGESNQTATKKSNWWRGRISSIDSFSFGASF